MVQVLDGFFFLQLLGQFNSLFCFLIFCQEEIISIIWFIEQVWYVIYGICKCFFFLLQCQLIFVVIQFFFCLVQLLLFLSIIDILWLFCFCYFLFSIFLLGKFFYSFIMFMVIGKNFQFIFKKIQYYFLFCFLFKFSFIISLCFICFGFILQSFCDSFWVCNFINCFFIMLFSNDDRVLVWFEDFVNGLLLVQKFMVVLIVLYIVFIFIIYVYCIKFLWRKSFLINFWWVVIVFVVLLGQVVQMVVDLQFWMYRDSYVYFGLEDVFLLIWFLGCLFLVFVVVINEIVKLYEIWV